MESDAVPDVEMPSPPEPSSARLLKAAKEGQSSKTPGGRKRTGNARISAACEACKKRKTKCSGGPPPCQLCKTLGTECVIDLSLDMRRRAAFRRTVDESKSFQDALNALIDGIREGPSTRLEVLFEHIKSGATNQEVTMAIQQYLMPSEDDDGDESMLLQPDSGGSIETEDFKISTGLSETSSPDQALSDTSRGKAAELAAMPLSTLLSSLKSQPEAQGESLLRQFLASKHSEKVILPAWSPAGKSPWKGAGPGINPPSISERITWHPALHVGEDPQQSQRQESHPTPASEERPHEGQADSTMLDSPDHAEKASPQGPTLQRKKSSPVVFSPTIPYFEPISNISTAGNEWNLCVAQEDQVIRLRIPRHLVLPLIVPDDSTMSRTYSDYLAGARGMLESGVPLTDILGSSDRVAVDLFFRPRQTDDKFDCASWACEVSRSYETDIFVRLATACLLTHMMRWLLVPNLESYKRIPDMMKPTPTQCMTPHIGAIETIPLPPVRDAAINKLRDWVTPLIDAGWSVNWPHSVEMAVERDSLTGATVLTQKFHEHVTTYDNWSVASQFLDAFPEVAGRIRIHEA